LKSCATRGLTTRTQPKAAPERVVAGGAIPKIREHLQEFPYELNDLDLEALGLSLKSARTEARFASAAADVQIDSAEQASKAAAIVRIHLGA
jgi:hypothetical protein